MRSATEDAVELQSAMPVATIAGSSSAVPRSVGILFLPSRGGRFPNNRESNAEDLSTHALRLLWAPTSLSRTAAQKAAFASMDHAEEQEMELQALEAIYVRVLI